MPSFLNYQQLFEIRWRAGLFDTAIFQLHHPGYLWFWFSHPTVSSPTGPHYYASWALSGSGDWHGRWQMDRQGHEQILLIPLWVMLTPTIKFALPISLTQSQHIWNRQYVTFCPRTLLSLNNAKWLWRITIIHDSIADISKWKMNIPTFMLIENIFFLNPRFTL